MYYLLGIMSLVLSREHSEKICTKKKNRNIVCDLTTMNRLGLTHLLYLQISFININSWLMNFMTRNLYRPSEKVGNYKLFLIFHNRNIYMLPEVLKIPKTCYDIQIDG